MILIDTSSWIDALRRDGNPAVRARVVAALRDGTACWCDMVRLELWNGVRGAAERRQLQGIEADVILLPTNDAVWARARQLAQRARAKGWTCPGPDLLIAACACEHRVPLEHDDGHLKMLMQLGSE
jgi:hypothetical protein